MKRFIIILCILYTPVVFGAVATDENGNYYISNKGVNGDITKWSVSIEELTLRKDDGTEIPLITESVALDITQAGAQQIAGYFTENVAIPSGTYTHVGIRFGTSITLRGAVQTGENEFRATGQTGTYSSLSDALNSAQDITLELHSMGKGYIPEDGEGDMFIKDGKSYTLKILWKVAGLEYLNETGKWTGVGLVWRPGSSSFGFGAFQEEFYFVDENGNEEPLSGGD